MTTEERLAKVERELAATRRRSRWLLGALGLALGAWVLAGVLGPKTAGAQGGATAAEEVRAKRFVMVDDKNAARAALAMLADGPGLVLYGAGGDVRVVLANPADGPGLILYDENGKTRAVLSVDKDGPGLWLYEPAGKAHAVVFVDKDRPGLGLCDAAGKEIWTAP